MTRLLVLADDFTGALDTGIQFAKAGIRTAVYLETLPEHLSADLQVIVIDTETRHLPPDRAAAVIGQVTRQAAEQGLRHFYKKTDSALRGNVGAELAALLHAAGQDRLYFAPAYPAMGRTTQNGIQYVDGAPVSESPFGRDPFEPVRSSSVREIIHGTAPDIAVHGVAANAAPPNAGAGIYVFDAISDDDLAYAVSATERDAVLLTAGCAGFASRRQALFQSGDRQEAAPPTAEGGLIVISGSVNAVSLAQQRCAAAHGFPRFTLLPEQKLTPGFAETDSFQRLRGEITAAYRQHRRVLVEAVDSVSGGSGYLLPGTMTQEEARGTVATNLGKLAAALQTPEAVTVIIGGDTLLALIRASGAGCITPLAEPLPGAVLSIIELSGNMMRVISKSGGFGDEDFLLRLQEILS